MTKEYKRYIRGNIDAIFIKTKHLWRKNFTKGGICMYGLKTPTYKGTNLKKSQIQPVCTSNFKVTRGNTKLYIAKSISEDVTHGISALMTNMTKEIIGESISRMEVK